MRLPHVLDQVENKPWMIIQGTHRAIRRLLEKKLAQTSLEASKEELEKSRAAERQGFFGAVESMTIRRGVAVIPVKGILARGVSSIEKSCGVCDYEDVTKDLKEAVSDPSISGIVLDVDSPGGMVNGAYELSDAVGEANAQKMVVAWTPGQMCSGAYYISLQATAIVAAPSASVGSVGVILQALDDSEAYKMAGMEVHTMRSDPLKAAGATGSPITPEQVAYFQGIVDEAADRFKAEVRRHRGISESDALDGRVFSAETAAGYGLIDLVGASIEDAIGLII